METRLSLAPGQNGTKKLLTKYGDRLMCVRYRYDPERKVRHKTVELIVETTQMHISTGAKLYMRIYGFSIYEMLPIRSADKWRVVRTMRTHAIVFGRGGLPTGDGWV